MTAHRRAPTDGVGAALPADVVERLTEAAVDLAHRGLSAAQLGELDPIVDALALSGRPLDRAVVLGLEAALGAQAAEAIAHGTASGVEAAARLRRLKALMLWLVIDEGPPTA